MRPKPAQAGEQNGGAANLVGLGCDSEPWFDVRFRRRKRFRNIGPQDLAVRQRVGRIEPLEIGQQSFANQPVQGTGEAQGHGIGL
jgi:hypothetical protein